MCGEVDFGLDCSHDDGSVGPVHWSTSMENTSERLCYAQKTLCGRRAFSELGLDFTGYNTAIPRLARNGVICRKRQTRQTGDQTRDFLILEGCFPAAFLSR